MAEAQHRWPDEWYSKRAGDGCPKCSQGRVDEDQYGVRFFSGSYADAYLQRMAPAVGYATFVFRGRHAADLADLTDEELAGYWSDVRIVALALRAVFAPVHLNYSVLGNEVPHLHTHVLPRYALDPAPMRPLPPDVWDTAARLTTRDLDEQVGRLKDAVALLR